MVTAFHIAVVHDYRRMQLKVPGASFDRTGESDGVSRLSHP